MSKKYNERRRAAFLRALGETGNVTVAAARARLHRSWVQRRRKLDGAFDALCRDALAGTRQRLADRDELRSPTGWGSLDGAELVVVRGAPGRRVQVRRARADGWSPAMEQRFLNTLATTCNVKASCAEIGMTVASAYYHRHRCRRSSGRGMRRWRRAMRTWKARWSGGR